MTKKECQTMIFNAGIKLGVSPRLISTRLLSPEDKEDMMKGSISIVDLEAAIAVWRDNGMLDYVGNNNR
jgi:hypothetical protein